MSTSDTRVSEEISDLEEPSSGSGRLRVVLEIAIALAILVGIYYLFAPTDEMTLPPLPPQEIDPIIRAQIDAAKQQPAAAAPLSVESTATEVDAASSDDTPIVTEETLAEGEAARRLIAGLRDGSLALTDEEILAQAKTFENSDSTSDAYLLLFYAAKQGSGEAAFELASLYDPAHFRQGSSLLQTPDAYQAHKWYSEAAKHEMPEATSRLQALRKRLQTEAANGDAAARRLLLNWQ